MEKGGQVEIIGWLYQYYNTEPKAEVFGRPSGTKIKKEDIPAVTQLFYSRLDCPLYGGKQSGTFMGRRASRAKK